MPFILQFLLADIRTPWHDIFSLTLFALTAILAIIFGYISRQRTHKKSKNALANISLAIGYILATFYVCLIIGFLIMLLVTWLGWYPFLPF